MNEHEKMDAPATPGNGTPTNQSSHIVAQPGVLAQGAARGDGGRNPRRQKGGQKAKLGLRSTVATLAIKCYIEQLPHGEDYTYNQIRTAPKDQYQIIAYVHNRDVVTDGIWKCPTEKAHLHIIIRALGKRRPHISTLLDALGVYFRPNMDESLWINGGIETVRNYGAYALYLRHETPEAIADGKAQYDLTEAISNLTIDEIREIEAGYVRVSANKLRPEELIDVDQAAYNLGYTMQDFDNWYNGLSFAVRSSAKMRTIRESYERGITAYIDAHKEIVRLCIYIQGPPNCGKTYAAQAALGGRKTLTIRGGGSGKLDHLRPTTDAILIDDDTCPNLLNLADNYPCRAYRRNSNNPVWAGHYLVVTSNLPFREWLDTCGLRTYDHRTGGESEHYKALRSRFYLCEIVRDATTGCSRLALRSASDRGSYDDQAARLRMYLAFRVVYDQTIAQYNPQTQTPDYSAVLELPDDTDNPFTHPQTTRNYNPDDPFGP